MNCHIASNPNGEKAFKCSMCDKTYVAKNGLDENFHLFMKEKELLNAQFVSYLLYLNNT